MKYVSERTENILGKGENAFYQHFLLSPRCFQKPPSLGLLKSGLCDKELIDFVQFIYYPTLNDIHVPYIFSGLNVSPAPQTTEYEIHITGDVAFGFQQYLMMSGETDLLKLGRLKEAIGAMADFWLSRVTYNDAKDRYELYSKCNVWHQQKMFEGDIEVDVLVRQSLSSFLCEQYFSITN